MKWLVPALLLAGTAAATRTSGRNRYLYGPGVNLVQVLPRAPQCGRPRYDADRCAFRDTHMQLETPPGVQAVGDVRKEIPTVLEDFFPAAGRRLTVESNPVLAALLRRIVDQVQAAVRDGDDEKASELKRVLWLVEKRLRRSR